MDPMSPCEDVGTDGVHLRHRYLPHLNLGFVDGNGIGHQEEFEVALMDVVIQRLLELAKISEGPLRSNDGFLMLAE